LRPRQKSKKEKKRCVQDLQDEALLGAFMAAFAGAFSTVDSVEGCVVDFAAVSAAGFTGAACLDTARDGMGYGEAAHLSHLRPRIRR
jgi:hypothetical protein